MKNYNCYICEQTFKHYENMDEYPYSLTEDTPDEVLSPLAKFPNYHFKTGFFSKESIFICKKCVKLIDDLYNSHDWCNKENIISSEGKKFIDENKKNDKFKIQLPEEQSQKNDSIYPNAEKVSSLNKLIDMNFYGPILEEEGYINYVALDGSIYRMKKDCWPDCGLNDMELLFDEVKIVIFDDHYHFVGDDLGIYRSKSEEYAHLDYKAACEKYFDELDGKLKVEIVELLKQKSVKMPASDIDAFLKYQNVEKIKSLCEKMYHNGEISRTANYRYFILTEEKKKPKSKKTAAPRSEAVDVKAELKKYKEMLDDGLITQEQYDAKSNELLGL